MKPDRICEHLANEIIDHYHLPGMCKKFIMQRISWAYAMGFDEARCQRGHEKRIIQFTLNGKIITTYDSIRKASQASEVEASNISKVARGRRKNSSRNRTAGNYKWEFEEDYYKRKNNQANIEARYL